MILPEEFKNRVYKTKLSGLSGSFVRLDEVRKEWEGSDIDVIFENGKSVIVVVFETPEDYLAFKLKYGDEYV